MTAPFGFIPSEMEQYILQYLSPEDVQSYGSTGRSQYEQAQAMDQYRWSQLMKELCRGEENCSSVASAAVFADDANTIANLCERGALRKRDLAGTHPNSPLSANFAARYRKPKALSALAKCGADLSAADAVQALVETVDYLFNTGTDPALSEERENALATVEALVEDFSDLLVDFLAPLFDGQVESVLEERFVLQVKALDHRGLDITEILEKVFQGIE